MNEDAESRLSTELNPVVWDDAEAEDDFDEDAYETVWSEYAAGSQKRADFVASISGVLSPDEVARMIEEIDRQIQLEKMYDEG